MANNKSAEKRIEINKRNRLQNKYYKTSSRTLIKLFFTTLEDYKISQKPEKKQFLVPKMNLSHRPSFLTFSYSFTPLSHYL